MINHPVHVTENKDAAGLYVCAACGAPLFEAGKKFDTGCGFPSFWMHVEDGVQFNRLSTYGRQRIQLRCSHCGRHLGHLFPNRFTPTGVRYCIGHDAICLTQEAVQQQLYTTTMAASVIENHLQVIREHRSNESSFGLLCRQLDEALAQAQEQNKTTLANSLQEVKEKQAAAYQKAKETSGSAWPEFENFVTHLERALTEAAKTDA